MGNKIMQFPLFSVVCEYKGLIEGRDLWLKFYQSKLLIKYLLYIQPWSLLRTQEKVGCCKLIWEESFYFILFNWWIVDLQWVSLIAQLVKNLPAVQKTPDLFLGWEEPLGKGKATHSSFHGLYSPWGLQRVGQDWVTLQCCVDFCCIAKWISYTYICSFSYSFLLWFNTGYWI